MLGGSFEVEVFSTPESPEANISVVENHDGPEPYKFKLLAPALVRHEARAPEADAIIRCNLVKNAYCKHKALPAGRHYYQEDSI